MSNVKSIMIVGVGGQGTLLASRILGSVAKSSGNDVKISEVHGMSQRGGSVVTYVKYGKKVYSPIISLGCADIILSFEELEAYRYASYLKKDGKIIVNTQKIDPMPVITGAVKYTENVIEKLCGKFENVIAVDALKMAEQAGNMKAVNVVLIGVLAKSSEIEKSVWEKAVEENVPPKFLEINKKAFELGYNYQD